MIVEGLGWVARRRVAVLVTAVLLAVAQQVSLPAVHSRPLDLTIRMVPSTALILGAALAVRVFPPAKLVARPAVPALDTPASPALVLMAASYTSFAALLLTTLIRTVETVSDVWFAALPVLIIGANLAAVGRLMLTRSGVRLTPDGIEDRRMYGDLFVPWAALTSPDPAHVTGRRQVGLAIARPDLVRVRGWRVGPRTLLPAVGVDPDVLARTINEYATIPDARSTIGSAMPLAGSATTAVA
ncbi:MULTISPECIES: hypothetical protein [unclassified Actinoplanes]|uniref:hypothetical protein n=1 Tax=unclassified Actinoplanes TaxID=2626549 RepID=UPI00043A2EA2|nr:MULTISPECIES: hypothetical protein [unclassified Actinoplanes]